MVRIIIIFIGLIAMFMIPKDHRLISRDDDDDYFAYATSIAFGNYPSFSKEYHVGEKMPFASGGSGVLASPFVFLFSQIDRLKSASIIEVRTKENRYWTWSITGFQFASIFYLIVGSLLLFKTLNLFFPQKISCLTTLLSLSSSGGVFIYAFRRPIMSHIYEFFSITLTFYLFSKLIAGKKYPSIYFHLGIAAGIIFTVRYNNLFLSATFVLLALHYSWKNNRGCFISHALQILLPAAAIILFIRIFPVIVNGYSSKDQGYNGVFEKILTVFDFNFYFKRLLEILFYYDMGLIFTAPALLISIILLVYYKNKMNCYLKYLALPLFINLYLVMIWKSFGSYYGYRFMVFTATPLLSIFLAKGLSELNNKINFKYLVIGAFILSIIPMSSILMFERNSQFSFTLLKNQDGVMTYTQPEYHKLLLKKLIKNPIQPLEIGWTLGFGSIIKSYNPNAVRDNQRLILYLCPYIILLLFEIIKLLGLQRNILLAKRIGVSS